MSRRLLGGLLLLSLALNAGMAAAFWWNRRGPCPRKVLPDAGLPPAKRALLERRFEAFQREAEPLRRQIRAAREELLRLLETESPDPAAVEAAHLRLQKAQDEMGRLFVRHLLEDKALLSPEERRAFFEALRRHASAVPPPGERNSQEKCP